MKTAAIIFCIVALGAFVFVMGKKSSGSKPVFYAKVIAKQAENLLDSDTVNWADFDIKRKPAERPYIEICQKAKNKKQQLASQKVDEAGKVFETLLLNEIIPYWYGTEWDFNGHTDTPGEGKVACGYFVSTTLLQIGVNLNRYELAQQTPENESKSLATGGKVIEISGEDISENLANIKAAIGDGICFVGLGRSHVGFLVKRKDELFFAHSSYLSPGVVIIELASKSPVFAPMTSIISLSYPIARRLLEIG